MRRLIEGDPEVNCFCVDEEGTLWFKDHLVVPKNHELRKKIFDEAHTFKYSIHSGSTKMYHDLKAQFWWTCMKRETTHYVAECDTCRRVKADHMRPAGLLQPLSIPTWKWEDINMNFIVGLPLTGRKFNFIWVIIDRLTKSAHFIQCTPSTGLRSTLNCILLASCVCMGCPRPSFLIRDLSLLLVSQSSCILPWECICSTAQLIIRRPMVKQRG
jgi:hypothetical protein